MANPWDLLGDDRDFFMKSSWKVFSNLSGAMQYVGKTQNEKTIRTSAEYIEWNDNTSGVQTLYVRDTDKFGFAIDFSFMQVGDPNILALAMNAEWDNSDANVHRLFVGSSPAELPEAQWRFVGQTRAGLDITIVIRKGVITMNGDWASGAPGDYTNIPVTCSAMQDTSITNQLRDLAYIEIQKKAAAS